MTSDQNKQGEAVTGVRFTIGRDTWDGRLIPWSQREWSYQVRGRHPRIRYALEFSNGEIRDAIVGANLYGTYELMRGEKR